MAIQPKRIHILQLALFWGLIMGFGEGGIYYARASWNPIAPDISRAGVIFEPLMFLGLAALSLLAGKPTWGALVRFHLVAIWCVLFGWSRLLFPLQKPAVVGLAVLIVAALLALFVSSSLVVLSRKTTWCLAVIAFGVAISVPVRHSLHEKHELARLPASVPGAPNVLLIVVDTLRADHLSTYGYARETSPLLSQLAAQGVLFENAIAPSSWTLPSHASILTGLYPHEHQAEKDGAYLSYANRTVGEAFEQAGYRTAAFSANTALFGRRVGFGRGFIHFEDDFQCWASSFGQTYWGARIYEVIYHLGIDRDVLGRRRAADINAHFLRWMKTTDRPFFAVLNYFDTHDPYLPPEPFRHLYSKAKNPGWYSSRSWVAELNPTERQEALDAYDGSINYVDAQVASLFGELRKRALDRNTIVIITSDHGESFDEHGFMDHGNALYRELIRVPLLVWGPGRVPGGKRVSQPVSLLELPNTLLTLAGVHTSMRFRGPSLTALWVDGAPQSFAPPVSELAQLKWNRRFPNYYGPMVSIITADWHYISGGSYGVQLFRCCDQNIEAMDLAQTALGGPVMQQLAAWLAAEGASDPSPSVPPREFRFAAVSPPEALAVADLNGDGNPDIAVAGDNGSRTVLLGDGTGRFARGMIGMAKNIRLQRAGLEAKGDLNGNGLEDLAVADPVKRTVRFVFRHANGNITTCTLRLDVSPDFITMADVNHNGSSDLVIASRENASITILLSGTAPRAEAAAAARR